MYLKEFNKDEKAKAFDRIKDNYYNKNFSSMSKSDLEVLLFDIFLNHLEDSGCKYTDYDLSVELGITQSRIRSLRERRKLKYNEPDRDMEWKSAFVELIKYSKVDEKKYVKVYIPDIEILIELRNFVESINMFDEYQLNPKVFSCRIDVFIMMCNKLDEDGISDFDKETRKVIKEIEKNNNKNSENDVKKFVGDMGKDVFKSIIIDGSSTLVKEVLNNIPFGNMAKKAVQYVIEKL